VRLLYYYYRTPIRDSSCHDDAPPVKLCQFSQSSFFLLSASALLCRAKIYCVTGRPRTRHGVENYDLLVWYPIEIHIIYVYKYNTNTPHATKYETRAVGRRNVVFPKVRVNGVFSFFLLSILSERRNVQNAKSCVNYKYVAIRSI